MQLRHIDLGQLIVSAANMRAKDKVADLDNILPSIRARGILVPLIVRAVGDDGADQGRYEIVAGRRRFEAALAVAAEQGGEAEPLPCAIIEGGDDASALEASLIENIARLDPDEVSRWETFTRLVREGRTAEEIALTFGLTALQVSRTLALGNLLPRIRTLYRNEQIDAVTIRHLTLASAARQKEWLALVDDPEAYAPRGSQLKAWLFGGASIPTSAALFDLGDYRGAIVADLFGEDSYFADADQFWTAQRAAIAVKADAYREAGWSEVIVLEPGNYFQTWEHERRSKRQGGKVFIAIGHRGEVAFHEGYVSRKEARRLEAGESARPSRPELTVPLNDYVDLHRHAAVREVLARDPDTALRVAVAHMIAGSPLWSLRIEPQRAASEAIRESVECSPSETALDVRRRELLALLGFGADTPTIGGGYAEGGGLTGLFVRLEALDQSQLLEVMAMVMAETLDARSDLVDALGVRFGLDMADCWQADEALLALIRDREVLLGMVAELAGEQVAEANAATKTAGLKAIIADCLAGSNGRPKAERWVPRWMYFPPSAYSERGGVGSVGRSERVASLVALDAEDTPHAVEQEQPAERQAA